MNDEIEKMEALIDKAGSVDEMYSIVRFQFPEFVADLARAYNFLYSDIPDIEKAECIAAACKVKHFLAHNRSHTKAVPTMKPYDAYKTLFREGKITAKLFRSAFSIVSHIELNPAEYEVSKDSLRAIEIWRNQGETIQHIYEYICMICTDPRSALKMDCLYLPEQCDFEKRHQSFVEAIRLIGKRPANKIDAVCAAYLSNDNHDVLLENLLAYFAFTSAIDVTDTNAKALIVGASPYYIRRWLKDGSMAALSKYYPEELIIAAPFYCKQGIDELQAELKSAQIYVAFGPDELNADGMLIPGVGNIDVRLAG